MSAPSPAERDAEYLKYGFLSIKAGNAIKNKLEGESLSQDEQDILRHAHELLQQISSGAELTVSGTLRGNAIDPLASMKALDFARDPIRHMQGKVKLHQLAELFAGMANTVQACSVSTAAPTDVQREALSMAAKFFEALYQYVANVLDRRSGTSFTIHQTGDLLPPQ